MCPFLARSFALPSFRKFSGQHSERLCEVVGDSRLYLKLTSVGGTVPCLGLCRPVCLLLSPAPGGLVALVPQGRLAVRLVLGRANLGSKCECGFSLGLLAQAAFAIGFLDTSWDFNRCEVQTEN